MLELDDDDDYKNHDWRIGDFRHRLPFIWCISDEANRNRKGKSAGHRRRRGVSWTEAARGLYAIHKPPFVESGVDGVNLGHSER